MAIGGNEDGSRELEEDIRSVSVQQTSSVASQMAAIDDEIASLYNRILLLKTQRNSISPISGLPNELLIRILTIYVVESDSLSNLKWTKLMYVCRRWHEVCIATQHLWSHIDISWRGDLERMIKQLERSGAAPLTIKIAFSSTLRHTGLLLEHSARIISLDLAGEAQLIHNVIADIPNHRFPVLESISLNPNSKREEMADGTHPVFQDIALDGNMPCLRSLSLSEIDLPWKSLRGLQELSLDSCFDPTTGVPPSFDVLLSVLQASPSLEVLKLYLVIPLPLPKLQYSVVELRSLAHISLRGYVSNCSALLNHLRIPAKTHMQLLPLGVEWGEDIRDILVPVRKHVRDTSAPVPALIKIDCNGGSAHRAIANFSVSIHADTAPPDILTPNAHLSINSHPETEPALRQIMSKIFKAIPYHSITHIDARTAPNLTVASWKAAMQLLPGLEMVYLFANNAAVNIGKALVQIESLGSARARYPRLKCIHLVALVWRDEDNATIAVMLETFTELLRLLYDHGGPLEVLVIDERDQCLRMSEARWEMLFGLVGKFIRNGSVYNPVQARASIAIMKAEWRSNGWISDSD
ncbi:hypothetical protein B0H10DRAFT_1950063 [Mycena sp. CBHHK59/15]|nr:hypothetical protein B0H10DRAFT_1950063 [Mycena sp. CBHHK59/15]